MQQYNIQQFGPYRVVSLIARGGMGAVYLAEDPRIKRRVAIKVMPIELSTLDDPFAGKRAAKTAARLQSEATAIARLDHPGIVRLLGYDEVNTPEGRYPYLVMDYYEEGSLDKWLRQHPNLSLQDMAFFIGQAANALQYAHDNKVIHEDIKPGNFLIRTRRDGPNLPDLLLTDFGVARFTDATSGNPSTNPTGTYTYMAPEQFDINARPQPATDQYALAVMTYELITGRPPFQGPLPAVMKQHIWDQPQPPSTFNPRLPREVDSVILRALAKKPEDRFPSITAFAQAFNQAVQGRRDNGTGEIRGQKGNDIYETISISPAEAQAGTSRRLTLRGERQVTVPVPMGVLNGQVLSLAGLGEPSQSGGPAGYLLVTVNISAPATPKEEYISNDSSAKKDSENNTANGVSASPNLWSLDRQRKIAIVIGSILCAIIDIWAVHGQNSFPIWYAIPVGSTSFNIGFYTVLVGLLIAIILFFGATFGPLVGLAVGTVGAFGGDIIGGIGLSAWPSDLGDVLVGFIIGFTLLRTRGRFDNFNALSFTAIVSVVAILICLALSSIFEAPTQSLSASQETVGYFTSTPIYAVMALVLLPIALAIYSSAIRSKGTA